MIAIEEEQLRTVDEIIRLLPRIRRGKKIHKATVYRWMSKGLRGVRLESIQVGGTRMASLEAVQRFFDRLNREPPPLREQRVEDAAAQLKQIGF